MTVETSTYISGLDATLPAIGDQKSEGPAHFHLIKSTVKATFPNVTGAVNASHTELNQLTGSNPITALSGLAGNGMVAKTSATTMEARIITAGAGVSVVNGDGVAGNPTIYMSPTIGAGDMLGPSGSTNNNIAVFDGTTGKLLKDSGVSAIGGSLVNTSDAQDVTNKTFKTGNTWQGNVITVTYGGTGAATLTGIVKGNGTSAMTAATPGTDYVEPGTATTFAQTQSFAASGIKLKGSSTGYTTFASANASGTDYIATFPASTGTVLTTAALVSVSQGGTGAGTITGMVKGNGTSAFTAASNTTDYVAPGGALGTPSSGTLSNCTADGTDSVGFRNIPQISKSTAYTCVLSDAGKHIFHPSSDATSRVFTIPANASVAYPIGTALMFICQYGAGSLNIAINTDTLRLANSASTGTRTIATGGVATAVKVTSTEWVISGVGVS